MTRILDHGYVEFIESWGSDERIVEAARMSTAKGFLGWGTPEAPGDEKLLGYLWRNKHATPFEMAGLIIEVKAPIFVFREWHRHRTQSYNEMSARYIPMPNENFAPAPETMIEIPGSSSKQAGTIKDAEALTHESALEWLQEVADYYDHGERVYQSGLTRGVRKEHARIVIPVSRYSRMRASANLRNWLAFLSLRMDPAAQWEIRQYAAAVGEIIATQFPRTWALFQEGRSK